MIVLLALAHQCTTSYLGGGGGGGGWINPGLKTATGIAAVLFLGGSGGGCMTSRRENGDRLLPLSNEARRILSGEPELLLAPQSPAPFLPLCNHSTSSFLAGCYEGVFDLTPQYGKTINVDSPTISKTRMLLLSVQREAWGKAVIYSTASQGF